MGLKKYIVASIIFIAVIAGYVFSIAQTQYEIKLFENTFSLPVAVWVSIPLVVLFIASVLHMIFYGLKHYISDMSVNKDEENILKSLKNSLVQKDEIIKFKNPILKDMHELLSSATVNLKKDSLSTNNKELNELAQQLIDIKNGKHVNLSVKLPSNNTWMIQNTINKINEQVEFALDVLKRPNNYTQEEIEAAFTKVIDEKSMTSVKKVLPNIKLTKPMIQELFKRDSVQEEFSLSKEELLKQIKSVEFDKNEYLDIAKLYKSSLTPDEIIEIFEVLSNEKEEALSAYVYVLFEFEMIDKIRDIFASTADDELTAFKALLDLKDAGKNYTLDAICYYN